MESLNYCLKKLDLSYVDFDRIMSAIPKQFTEYKSYYPIVRKFEKPISWGNKVGIIPDTVYKKYFSFDLS